jgi:hypothetical protein
VGPRVRAGRCNVSSLEAFKARRAARDAALAAVGVTAQQCFQLGALRYGNLMAVPPPDCLTLRIRGLIDTRGQLTDAGHRALAVWEQRS